MYRNKSQRKWQRSLIFLISCAFVLMQFMPGLMANAEGGTTVSVKDVPSSATGVSVNVDGIVKDCTKKGELWAFMDGGWYDKDDILSVTVLFGDKSTVFPRSSLEIETTERCVNIQIDIDPKLYNINHHYKTILNGTPIVDGKVEDSAYAYKGAVINLDSLKVLSYGGKTYAFDYSDPTTDPTIPRNEKLTIDLYYTRVVNTYSIDTTVAFGKITPDESNIPSGEDRTIQYSPDKGYHLASVTIDGADAKETNPNSVTFSNIAANHTVDVVYELNKYSIDTTVTNGTITNDESGIPYGADRIVKYSPKTGFHLVNVTVDGKDVTETNPDEISFKAMDADHTVVVVYESNKYGIDTTVMDGTITNDETGIPYGEDRTVKYSPKTGFHLVSVTVDGKDVTETNPEEISFKAIDADHTVVVVYESNKYGIDTTVTDGTITNDESGIPFGENRTVKYSPNAGFHLVSVTVDGKDVTETNPHEITFSAIDANHTVAVVYEVDRFSICTSVVNGIITPDEDGIAYGSDRTIHYTPFTGFHLLSVKVDGKPVDILACPDSYTFEDIAINHTIDVVYCINLYTVKTSVVNGTISPTFSGIPYGLPIFPVAYAPDPGCYLVSVTVDGVAQDINDCAFLYLFKNVTANHTVDVVYAPCTFSIDTQVTGGTITPDQFGIPYATDKTITYSPNTGYHLVSVTVDGNPVDIAAYPNSYKFECIKSNHTIAVVYEIDRFTIDTAVTNGTITPDESGIPYGDDRTVTYSPNVGYHVSSVTVDGAAADIATHPTSYAFNDIAANHTIAVVFEIDKFSIDTAVTNGTITPDESDIAYGSTRTVTYSPGTGYHLVSVTVDGVAVNIATYPNSYAFNNIAANHTIVVVYQIDMFTIDTAVTNGTITPDASVAYGSSMTVTYSANDGYAIKSVTVDGVAVDVAAFPGSYTFNNITANHAVVVVYESSDIPDTGDQGNIPLYVALMALSLLGLVASFGMARAPKQKNR